MIAAAVMLAVALNPACGAGMTSAPAVSSTAATADVGATLKRIEAKVAGVETLKSGFVEVKKLAALSAGITIEGELFIEKSGRLAWHVLSPMRYSVIVTDTAIRQWDEETDRVQEISIASLPMMKTVIDQMSVWFTGRYASLLDEFEVALEKEAPVQLRFTPRAESMAAAMIRSVSVGMRADERYLEWITIVETGGDSTTITFRDTVLNPELRESDFEVKGRV